ncbi:MAG: N-acetyltransferase family protein [Halobacteriota archaeon]
MRNVSVPPDTGTEAESRLTEPARRAERSNLRIRKARLSDLQGILQLYAQLFAGTDQAEENAETITPAHRTTFSEIDRDPGTSLLVAESSGRVLGTLSVTIVPNLSHRGRHWAIIENVVVDKDIQRASVGTALVQYAIALAQERDCFQIVLSSSVHRKDSHRFYKSLGFEAYGYSFKRYLSDT